MKNRFLMVLTAGLIFVFAGQLKSQDKGFGIGLIAGEPTGLSAKLWTTNDNAFDFGLGFSVGGDRINYKGYYNGDRRLHFHMDYLWHSMNVAQGGQRFPFYYGIGGRYNDGGGYEGSFGVRGVFGIAWWPQGTPIDLFAEIVPVFQLTPEPGFGFDAGVGIRFFFN